MMENDGEIWKDIVGYEGRHQVSNYGRIKSLDINLHKRDGKIEFRKGKILKASLSAFGYPQYCFSSSFGKRKLMRIHRVVAEAFIPNPDKKPFIDHINRIKTDNNVNNLRWCTGKENMNNPLTREWLKNCRPSFHHSEEVKKKIGLLNKGRIFKESTREKLRIRGFPVMQFTISGDFIMEYKSPYYAQSETGALRTHIVACCNGKRKTAGGYRWVYKKNYKGKDLPKLANKKRIYKTGYKQTKQAIINMRKSKEKYRKAVLVFSLDGSFLSEYPSIIEAGNATGTNFGSICNCCRGRIGQSNGYRFKYKDI